MNAKRQKELKNTISERIASILAKKGLKQQFLADKLKTDKSYVSHILHGSHNLTIGRIAEIEGILGEKILKF